MLRKAALLLNWFTIFYRISNEKHIRSYPSYWLEINMSPDLTGIRLKLIDLKINELNKGCDGILKSSFQCEFGQPKNESKKVNTESFFTSCFFTLRQFSLPSSGNQRRNELFWCRHFFRFHSLPATRLFGQFQVLAGFLLYHTIRENTFWNYRSGLFPKEQDLKNRPKVRCHNSKKGRIFILYNYLLI